MAANPTVKLRKICLALPDTYEIETWGEPTFRTLKGKIFCMQQREDARKNIWFKAPPGSQQILIEAAPEVFFRPPYFGHKGWVGMWLDDASDWNEVKTLVERSYAMVAPKKRRLIG
jgi:predicted DNA-binding protein (MmcQ/YjbR family)